MLLEKAQHRQPTMTVTLTAGRPSMLLTASHTHFQLTKLGLA